MIPEAKRLKTTLFNLRMRMMCAALALPALAGAETFAGRVTAVPDGDTVWVQPADGSTARKLRLQGIDAPEICQSGGAASRTALNKLVGGQTVQVSVKYHDKYGRGLAHLRLKQQDVAALMVQAGQAWSNRWHRSLGPYATEESVARQAKIGIFSAPNAELPSNFRKRHGSCYAP